MSLELYIPEKEILKELLIRAKREAYEQGCELDFAHSLPLLMREGTMVTAYPSIFTRDRDRQYHAFLAGMRDRQENLTLLDVVDGIWFVMEDCADRSVPGDSFFDDLGAIWAAGRKFPKVEMHFWTVYIFPHLCGWRELLDIFFDELRMISSKIQGQAYERERCV